MQMQEVQHIGEYCVIKMEKDMCSRVIWLTYPFMISVKMSKKYNFIGYNLLNI